MAMNAARLASGIKAGAALSATDRDAGFLAVAQAFIDEITNHAEVEFPAGTITVPGVTAGGAVVTGAGAGGSIT